MHRRQQQPKPSTTTCHGCGKIVSLKDAISMYEFICCSTSCMDPFRTKRQAEERAKEEIYESKRTKHGAFTFSSGGGTSH
jgi:hypothetical protein